MSGPSQEQEACFAVPDRNGRIIGSRSAEHAVVEIAAYAQADAVIRRNPSAVVED